MLEILAPAGNYECAHAAIMSGANAIYLGLGSFSARASAGNFDAQSFQDILSLSHLLGVKVYVAMNTVVKDEEVQAFLQSLLQAWNLGADAIILQDVFLGKLIHEQYPQIVLHLSTQAGVCNIYGAKIAKEYGFSRVIVARETPLEEIEKIACIIETEVFVQGALCTCFSGQCYLSSFAGGNSGNRGRCKQPCRKLYSINRKGKEERSYALSLSDLCVGDNIQKLIEAGVVSFKIEGRMRRKEYVSAAVSYYKRILEQCDEQDKNEYLSALKRTYNRGNYTKGLAFGQDKRLLSCEVQGHLGEKVGVVSVQNGKYYVESVFQPSVGDAFKILRKGKEIGGAIFLKQEGRRFTLTSKARLLNGDSVFITTDTRLNERLNQAVKKRRIALRLRFQEGERAVAQFGDVCVQSETILQRASSSPLTQEDVQKCFLKTDGLPFEIAFDQLQIVGDIFFAKSQLNAFRREVYKQVKQTLIGLERETLVYQEVACSPMVADNNKTAIIVTNSSLLDQQIDSDICIYKPQRYGEQLPKSFIKGKFEKYIYYSALQTQVDLNEIAKYAPYIDGIYAENYGGLAFAKEHRLKVFAGTGFNLTNSISVAQLLQEGVEYYAVSKELETHLQQRLCCKNAFMLTGGDIKVMDLCYCPFEKTCRACDQKEWYELTDENGRVFPLRRYQAATGECRFELYNCACLLGHARKGIGKLLDASKIPVNKLLQAADNEEQLKALYIKYTAGHNKNIPLL